MASIYLNSLIGGKKILIYETKDRVENYYRLLFKFLVNQLNIVPKSIKDVNFNINDPSYLNAFAYRTLGIALDLSDKKSSDVIDLRDIQNKDVIETNGYLFSNNTLDMKLILNSIRNNIKDIEFTNIDNYLDTVYTIQVEMQNSILQDKYINKLLLLPTKIHELYLISLPEKSANKVKEELINLPVEAYIQYYPGSIIPLKIKLSSSANINKTLEKAAKLYLDYYQNPIDVLLKDD